MESVIASTLNALLGQYVDGLNNVNFSVAGGDLQLDNLAIKKEAFQDLKLPIYVKSGAAPGFRCSISFDVLRRLPWEASHQNPVVQSQAPPH